MANNRHPALAPLVEQMRKESRQNEEAQNTHTNEEVNMTNNREAARQHLMNILTKNTKEDRTNAITNLLRLSDQGITREQVEKATSKPSPGEQLAGLADTNLRSR